MTQFAFFRPTNSSKPVNEPSNNNNIMKWTGHKKTTFLNQLQYIYRKSHTCLLTLHCSGANENGYVGWNTINVKTKGTNAEREREKKKHTRRFGFDFDILWPNEIKPFLTVSFGWLDGEECFTHENTDNQPKHLELINDKNKSSEFLVSLIRFPHFIRISFFLLPIVTQIDVSISLNDDFKSIIPMIFIR